MAKYIWALRVLWHGYERLLNCVINQHFAPLAVLCLQEIYNTLLKVNVFPLKVEYLRFTHTGK